MDVNHLKRFVDMVCDEEYDHRYTECGAITYDRGKKTCEINMSRIYSKLIEQAARWCEHYASDILIMVIDPIKEMISSGNIENKTMVFGLYDSGVNDIKFDDDNFSNVSDYYYRAIWVINIIVRDNGQVSITMDKVH